MDPIPDVLHNEYSELLINDTVDLARALTVPWKDRQVQIPPPEGLGVGGEGGGVCRWYYMSRFQSSTSHWWTFPLGSIFLPPWIYGHPNGQEADPRFLGQVLHLHFSLQVQGKVDRWGGEVLQRVRMSWKLEFQTQGCPQLAETFESWFTFPSFHFLIFHLLISPCLPLSSLWTG